MSARLERNRKSGKWKVRRCSAIPDFPLAKTGTTTDIETQRAMKNFHQLTRLFVSVIALTASVLGEEQNPSAKVSNSEMGKLKPVIKDVKRRAGAKSKANYENDSVFCLKYNPSKPYYFGATTGWGMPNFEFEYFPEFEFYRWRIVSALHDGPWVFVEYRK
jgi:hypothetical protein